mmetsp:Transcript_64207/g.198822  ORF Transcript_64207/g.198822 Transcript_64207/m.198822 type:complete len:239 (-) Transcript_64207:969-1685(-)
MYACPPTNASMGLPRRRPRAAHRACDRLLRSSSWTLASVRSCPVRRGKRKGSSRVEKSRGKPKRSLCGNATKNKSLLVTVAGVTPGPQRLLLQGETVQQKKGKVEFTFASVRITSSSSSTAVVGVPPASSSFCTSSSSRLRKFSLPWTGTLTIEAPPGSLASWLASGFSGFSGSTGFLGQFGGMGSPHLVRMSSAASVYSSCLFSSGVFSSSQMRPLWPIFVSAWCTLATLDGSGPPL